MIKARNISKKYGKDIVLQIEQLDIPKGQIFGLVGNNGAGKTTLFNLILDLIQPTTGDVFIKDINVQNSEDWKQITGSYIDESYLIGYLTPDEYFSMIGELRGMNEIDVKNFLEPFRELFNDEVIEKKKYLRDLSKGNQKKVGIVGALMGDPELVILDEPFANLDPTTQIRLKKLIQNYIDTSQTTFLISSHDLGHVTEVCQRILLLEKGKVVKDIVTSEETLTELHNYFSI